MTKPHAVAWTVWFPWVPPISNQDQEEDQFDDGVAAAEIIDGESPYRMEAESELNDSPIPDSVRATWERSSSGGVTLVSNTTLLLLLLLAVVAVFLGSGGNCLLLFAQAETVSSFVGDSQEEEELVGCDDAERFEWRLECNWTVGISPLIVPGHGIATDTSLHGNCSWDLVVIKLRLPEFVLRASWCLQT